MGYEFRVYLGPYMVCLNPRIEVAHSVLTCSKDDCPRSMRAVSADENFCPRCGAPVAHRAVTRKKQKIDIHDVVAVDTFVVFGADPDRDILLPNRTTWGARPLWLESDLGESEIEITPALVSADAAVFIRDYREHIDKVVTAYGKGNVEIKWGVLSV